MHVSAGIVWMTLSSLSLFAGCIWAAVIRYLRLRAEYAKTGRYLAIEETKRANVRLGYGARKLEFRTAID